MSASSHWFTRAWQSVWGALHAEAGEDRSRQKVRQMTNAGPGLLLVVTEPEGEDFWLLPGETVEIRAAVDSDFADFELSEDDAEVIVRPSPGMGHISVWRHGRPLPCGHQRPTE